MPFYDLYISFLLFSSVAYLCPTLRPHESQHARISQCIWSLICLYMITVCISTLTGPALCDPIDCSMPGFSVHHHLPEFTQTHIC